MHVLDWFVIFFTQVAIVLYGLWRTRNSADTITFFKAGKSQGWVAVGLSVMATQASAITFLSGPGQAFSEGMGFLQFYFGLPLAMLVIILLFIKVYEVNNVTTAYEFLEMRFGLFTRIFTATLFLLQRGLAAGFTIFAPSLVVSALLGWDIKLTNLLCGLAVILYTTSGGSKAVAETQKLQMAVMMAGLFFSLFLLIYLIYPTYGNIKQIAQAAVATGRTEVLDFSFDLNKKYTLWSGLIGGFFVALAYFGTDQSQVARYIGGKNIREARRGLAMNALLKIPMQALVLLCGVFLFLFYVSHPQPLSFNPKTENELHKMLEKDSINNIKQLLLKRDSLYHSTLRKTLCGNDIAYLTQLHDSLNCQIKNIIEQYMGREKSQDTNFIFLRFVVEYFPVGILGLVISMLFSAAMSSASSELNALASVTCIDFITRIKKRPIKEKNLIALSRWATLFWGAYSITFSMFAGNMGTLIEAVNVLGSLIYGTVLGIFLVGFFTHHVKQGSVLIAAAVSETFILILFIYKIVPFLWFNVIGCILVILISLILGTIQNLIQKN